jgi:hypothetical protein
MIHATPMSDLAQLDSRHPEFGSIARGHETVLIQRPLEQPPSIRLSQHRSPPGVTTVLETVRL